MKTSISPLRRIAVESLRVAMSEPGLEASIEQVSRDGKLAFEKSGANVSLDQDGAVSLVSLDLSVR